MARGWWLARCTRLWLLELPSSSRAPLTNSLFCTVGGSVLTQEYTENEHKRCSDQKTKGILETAQECKDLCTYDPDCKRAAFWTGMGNRCYFSASATCKEWKECKGCGLKTYEKKGLSISPVVISLVLENNNKDSC